MTPAVFGFFQLFPEGAMVFSDLIFLFFFLPAVILVTKLSPKPWRNVELLLFSLLFYA